MSNDMPHQSYSDEEEIGLVDIWNILWNGRILVFGVTAIFAVLSIVIALMLTNIYRADSLLAPIEEGQSNSAITSQFGIAANIAGINLNQSSTKTQNAIAILQSREFVKEFISKHDLLVPLMASKWNKETGRNVTDPELYDEASQTWIGNDESNAPSDWNVYLAFSGIMSVSQNEDTGLVTVSIDWNDPRQAAEWVNWLVTDINEKVRAADLAEANNAIAYLRAQILTTQLVEMQRVFYQLIESQTRIVMLADVRDEYVFKVIDPAVVSEQRVSPRRAMICILGTILGGMLASIYLLISHYARKNNSADGSAN